MNHNNSSHCGGGAAISNRTKRAYLDPVEGGGNAEKVMDIETAVYFVFFFHCKLHVVVALNIWIVG